MRLVTFDRPEVLDAFGSTLHRAVAGRWAPPAATTASTWSSSRARAAGGGRHGAAVGIGFTLLPHCDLVLAADTARFRTPFAAMGVPPEAASSVPLPERMGAQQAARVLFNASLDAEEAGALGVALRTAPAASAVDEALASAAEVAANPLTALRAIKATVLAGRNPAVTAARRREDAAFARAFGLPEPEERWLTD